MTSPAILGGQRCADRGCVEGPPQAWFYLTLVFDTAAVHAPQTKSARLEVMSALNGGETVLTPAVVSQTRTAATVSNPAGDWLCAWCLNPVANESDRFKYEGTDQFNFANPEGIRFAIITFSRTRGCHQTGLPTLEHTWFAGHRWSFCHCDRCGQHLGWYYTGKHDFAGLIMERIVRGLTIRN